MMKILIDDDERQRNEDDRHTQDKKENESQPRNDKGTTRKRKKTENVTDRTDEQIRAIRTKGDNQHSLLHPYSSKRRAG